MSSSDTSPGVSQDMILGEMRGQLREVVHSMNNLSQKFEFLSREVTGLAVLGAEMAALKSSVATLKTGVAELEMERNRRDGATGAIGHILKSPMLAALVGVIAAAVTGGAIQKGWVHLP